MAQSFVDEFIPRIEQLKNCRSLGDLAHILGYKPQALSYILYKIPDESKYSEFEIPKKKWWRKKNSSSHVTTKKTSKAIG